MNELRSVTLGRPPVEAFEEMRDRGAPSCARGPTVLLLGAELQQLPWESLPCLRSSGQSITRMPCLPFVLARNQQPSVAVAH